MTDSNFFVNCLKKFNRKERFYLVAYVLGNKDFRISDEFISDLQEALPDTSIDFEKALFAGMDYHLDWIYAALFLTLEKENCHKEPYKNRKNCISATQQDIDFIVAFADKINLDLTHLVLIEAKGATGWGSGQFTAKAKRMKAIFSEEEQSAWSKIVKPHFLITSPKKTDRLKLSDMPSHVFSGKIVPFIRLPNYPENQWKVTRCDCKGKKEVNEKFWKVEILK